MGQSREITNRIQKLRKSVGISIDDQIEVFHSEPNAGTTLAEILKNHGDKIKKAIKMPFMSANFMQPGAVVIGQIDYETEDKESVTLFICKPAVQISEEAVLKAFPGVKMDSLRTYLNSFSADALAKELNGGSLKLKLDGKDIELKHKEHMWMSAKDRQ